MSTDVMRKEFERTNGRDHRRQPPKGNNYTDPMAQADWEAFQKGWAQSRVALVIELPKVIGSLMYSSDVYEAVEAAGVKVKP